MEKGDRVILARVRHSEFKGIHGTIKKIHGIKRKEERMALVCCDNGKTYDAFLCNLDLDVCK